MHMANERFQLNSHNTSDTLDSQEPSGGQLDIPNDRWSEGSLVRKSGTGPNGQ